MDGHLRLPVLQVLLVVGLDGDHVLGLLVGRAPHHGKGALADLQVDLEVFQLERLLVWMIASACIDQLSEVAELHYLLLRLVLCLSHLVRL